MLITNVGLWPGRLARNCCELYLVYPYQCARPQKLTDQELMTLVSLVNQSVFRFARLSSLVCYHRPLPWTSVAGDGEFGDDAMIRALSHVLTKMPCEIGRVWLTPSTIAPPANGLAACPKWRASRGFHHTTTRPAGERHLGHLCEVGGVRLDLLPHLPLLRLAHGTVADLSGFLAFLQRQPSLQHVMVDLMDVKGDAPADVTFPCQRLRSLTVHYADWGTFDFSFCSPLFQPRFCILCGDTRSSEEPLRPLSRAATPLADLVLAARLERLPPRRPGSARPPRTVAARSHLPLQQPGRLRSGDDNDRNR